MTGDIEFNQEERTSLAKERTRLANERNRLANERTFLAWIRTGLAIVGGGIAVIRLLSFEHMTHLVIAKVIGLILILLGMGMFSLAYIDYRKSCLQLNVKTGLAGSTWTIFTIVVVLVFASLLALLIL